MDDLYDKDILSRYQVPGYRLTVSDYQGEGDRGELLEGQMVE